MSRFARLRKQLPFGEAFTIYRKIKTGRPEQLSVSKLKHPFSMRNTPYDFATFEEVILNEAYNIHLDFTPRFIIDGGGNIGLAAVYFASKYPGATIVSVEPDQENFSLLQQNAAPYKNIIPMNNGIWNKTTSLCIKDVGLGSNGLIIEEALLPTPGSIASLSIQDILEKMNWEYVDFLKLDVEGSEKEIFSGGYEDWLPKTKVLIIELHDRLKKGCSKAVFSAINQYDFSVTIAGENLVFINNQQELFKSNA